MATALASLVASDMYDAVKVSPDFHGTIEQPSARFSSDLHRPVGSRVDVTLTDILMYDGIVSSMPRKMILAFHTAEPMSSKVRASTVVADVGTLTEWCT